MCRNWLRKNGDHKSSIVPFNLVCLFISFHLEVSMPRLRRMFVFLLKLQTNKAKIADDDGPNNMRSNCYYLVKYTIFPCGVLTKQNLIKLWSRKKRKLCSWQCTLTVYSIGVIFIPETL